MRAPHVRAVRRALAVLLGCACAGHRATALPRGAPNATLDFIANDFRPPIYNITASSMYDAGRQHGVLAAERIAGWFAGDEVQARPSPIPSPCTQFTRTGIKWRRCHRAACMARSCQEHHRSVRAEP